MPLLSVIIPVYKVEKYLHQCVDSVINQNLQNIEIILVDDGSPDSCPKICDDYAEKYDYIKVIHKPNGGPSSARNAGIDVAQGEYLVFLDSDDWWNPSINVNEMLDYVNSNPQTEMFLFTAIDYLEGQGYFKRNEHIDMSGVDVSSVEEFYRSLLNRGNMEVAAYTKFLKTSFIKENDLYFTRDLLSEDNEWMIRLLRVLNSVDIIDKPLYIYRAGRPDSITGTIKKKNISDLLWIIKQSIEFYKANKDFHLKNYELCFTAYLWFCAMGLCTCLSKQEKNELYTQFRETSIVCSYSNSRKTKMCRVIYRLFGLHITIFVLGKYIKFKGNKTPFKTKVDI